MSLLIANPTSVTYLNRRPATEEHVAIRDRERVKNDKYAQRCQQIDTTFNKESNFSEHAP